MGAARAELRPSKAKAKFDQLATSLRPGRLRRVALQTARLWREHRLSYDEAIEVAGQARRELELERPTKRRRVIERLTRPELEQLLAEAYRRQRFGYGLMVKTLVLTGARVSEFVAIKVRDFSLDGCSITIRKGKGGKERIVPILPELAQELQTHLGAGFGGGAYPLFPSRLRKHFTARRVQQILKETSAAAGIARRVYPHLMRHTIAQHLLEGGMPLEQVSRFLGHEKLETTQIYAESSPAMIAGSYRRALRGSE